MTQILRLLTDEGFEFVIVGGFAGVFYGSTLVTRDLDLCLSLRPSEITRLRSVLAPYDPVHRMTPRRLSFLVEPRSLEGIHNVYLDTTLGSVDFLSEIKGVGPHSRVLAQAETIQLQGRAMKVISLDDLIRAKQAMGRDKDLFAVRELEMIKAHRLKT